MTTHASKAGSLHALFAHARFYDRMSRVFRFRRLYERAVADVRGAGLPAGARVLDVGTGPGRVPIAIAQTCPHLQVEGLDAAPQMIDYARRTAGPASPVHFTVADVADLPHPDHAIDLVISTMSLHHWADAKAGMRELSRVLTPGGQVWIYDFRFALRRTEAAARAAFPRHLTRIETISALTGRVVVRPA